MNKPLLILGGYGNAGLCLAKLLLQETAVTLILAGRDQKKAELAAAMLSRDIGGKRVSGLRVDAGDRASLDRAFRETEFVLVASSTAEHTSLVAQAAISAGIDYLDIQYSSSNFPLLKSMAGKIRDAGRCFITEAGFHPGLPAAMVRYAAPEFDRMDRAVVASLIRQDWRITLSHSTIREFVQELRDYEITVFKNGRWQKAAMGGMTAYRKFDFGPEFGKQYCVPMKFEEMRTIPNIFPAIKETGFYISGLNWFVDWFAFPVVMVALKIWPEKAVDPMAKFLFWGLRTFSSPPYRTFLKVEASGEKDGKAKATEVSISHEDGYMFTAIPVVACLLQYLDGSIAKPGLWMMAHLVEPARLMADMERMGIRVEK